MTASLSLITIELRHENDIVLARQRTRDVAELLGMSPQDQTRLATAVSEISRNAWTYAGGGKVELLLEADPPTCLVARVVDQGRGIAKLEEILSGSYQSATGMGMGLVGTRRLMDAFEVKTGPKGTTVTFKKQLPPSSATRPAREWADRITHELALRRPRDPLLDVREQNRELLETLEALRRRELELEDANRQLERANRELEDTNRGVVALYAELDARAEFARKASELKTRFLSHLSHEFRTPLGSVLSLTDMLLARLDGPLNPEQEMQVKLIRKSTSTLSELVEDLLDIARVESGKTQVRAAEFTVADLFNALRGMVRPLLTNPNVQLVFEADPVPALQTDEGKLSQILRNLVSNALKFTESGEIRVRAEESPGGFVLFQVSDTGIGIAPRDRERIFEEFVQVEGRLQSRHKGTGLGLPLSRKLAQLLGGSLNVTSEPGKGSTFSLRLPRVVSAQAAEALDPAAAGAATLPSGDGRRLLVVDDHDATRYLISAQLRAAGYEVEEAAGGMEALQRARQRPPDGVILDLAMPDKSGYDVLAELKAEPQTAAVPVIIYSSKTLNEDDLARLSAAAAFVGKPETHPADYLVDMGEALIRAGLSSRREGASA